MPDQKRNIIDGWAALSLILGVGRGADWIRSGGAADGMGSIRPVIVFSGLAALVVTQATTATAVRQTIQFTRQLSLDCFGQEIWWLKFHRSSQRSRQCQLKSSRQSQTRSNQPMTELESKAGRTFLPSIKSDPIQKVACVQSGKSG